MPRLPLLGRNCTELKLFLRPAGRYTGDLYPFCHCDHKAGDAALFNAKIGAPNENNVYLEGVYDSKNNKEGHAPAWRLSTDQKETE